MHLTGMMDRTVDDLPSPRAKFAGNPHVSGRDGGQNLNLHQFARDGVVLLGHLQGVSHGDRLHLAPDLPDSLAKADAWEAQLTGQIDRYIVQNGIDAPPETLPVLRDGYEADEITNLSLRTAEITTVVWAMGYSFDFGIVKLPLPVVDGDGFPIQQLGVAEYPGLYFVGMPWMPKWKSGLFMGVGESAEHIAEQIALR